MVIGTRCLMVSLLAFLALGTGGRGQARGRESARLPFYCPLDVDAKAGVAFVAGSTENLETWDLHVWREGRQPVKIMSAEGLIASLSASPDGSSVLVCDLTHPAGSEGADSRVTWVQLSTALPVTKEFHREVIKWRGAAWDCGGARWVAHKQRDGYVIHSGRGETALVAPQSRSRVLTETYWLPDSSESAYVVKADGAVYRISAKTDSVVTQVRLPEGARIAGRGHTLLAVSDKELMCVDLERGTTTTRPLAGEAKQLRHLRAAVPLGDEWLGLVAAGERSDEAGVFLLRRRDASVEFLANVPVEPELVEMAGDEQGLCVAWPDLAKRETTLRWFDLPK
jgi:hypothetical protein